MGRILVIGDIHGRVEALKQVLERCKFDNENDKLICLGDVADGGYSTYECVEELLKIKNLVYIIGNHDEFFMNHIKTGWAEDIWLSQGGKNTLRSYGWDRAKIPVTHQDFFNNAKYWYEEEDMLFVHGGVVPGVPMEQQKRETLTWDREIIEYAKNKSVRPWKKVFIGHTTTQNINGTTKPVILNNVYCVDTGAGWNGCLTIMNAKNDAYWQSDVQEPAL